MISIMNPLDLDLEHAQKVSHKIESIYLAQSTIMIEIIIMLMRV